VGKPAPITVSAVERGTHEIRERLGFADTSDAAGRPGNVLEGDLSQLVEKLHRLETGQLKQFVRDLRTALQDADLEQSGAPESDSGTTAALSVPAVSTPDVIEHVAEYAPITESATPPSIPEARPLPARVRTRWSKRAGLFLALSAVTASIPWEWPILFVDLPQAPPMIREPVTGRDAPEVSASNVVVKETAILDGTISSAAPAPNPSLVTHDIEVLIDRGDLLLRRGDVIAARSFYERAAPSGSARAAIGIARTFDPLFLMQLGVVGVLGDPERAAFWYGVASEAANKEK